MKDYEIMGIKLPFLAILLVVLLAAIGLGVLPGGMIGAFAFMMIVGAILNQIGNVTPIIKTFFGGGPIVVIFGSAALVYFKVLPEGVVETVDTFMKGGGFLDFYIAALITGSLLGMSRKLLIKASVRYLPCILGGVVVALLFVGIGGLAFGNTIGESIAYIGIPIMGGGMGAGAVPISEVFSSALGLPTDEILSRLVPAVALGNAMAIVAGGFLDRLGQKFPSLTGNGKLMDVSEGADDLVVEEEEEVALGLKDYGIGIAIATVFFIFGRILAFGFKELLNLDLHSYAWMILSVAIVKAFDLMPKAYERACHGWYQFVASNWTPALLMGIGISYTNLGQVIEAISVAYVILVFLVIVGAIVGTAVVGKWVGFYPIEAAITAGLCMANMGGTGDVAVLTAAKRMELMPFAQISSRLGGAFLIFLATILVPLI